LSSQPAADTFVVEALLKHLFGLEQVAAVNYHRGFQQGYILPGRVVFR